MACSQENYSIERYSLMKYQRRCRVQPWSAVNCWGNWTVNSDIKDEGNWTIGVQQGGHAERITANQIRA